jgi:hypothetical protein
VAGISLEVVRGPDAGRRFPIPIGHYRVLGRSHGVSGGTAVVSQGERRRLDSEDQRRISEHLKERGATAGKAGARDRVDSFERQDDLDLADDAVSQTHAMVFVDEAGVSLIDVDSTNGTFVNGRRVSEAELVSGDLLRVGETRVEIRAS